MNILWDPKARSVATTSLLTRAFVVLLFLAPQFVAAQGQTTSPLLRITEPINDLSVVQLTGNIHPKAQPKYDQGPVDPSMKMGYITLFLKPSPEQREEITKLVAEQQDRTSTNYHKWLTPEQFGDRFGLNKHDMNEIIAWLKRKGFTVEYAAHSRTWVAFSGTAELVQKIFHTEIHHYMVNGDLHYANSVAISIPAAFQDVVSALHGLDDFYPRPHYTSGQGQHFLAPGDIATIYDLNRLYDIGIDGTGQTIAVVGDSNIDPDDISAFRSMFGLSLNTPQQQVVHDPQSTTDLIEADLDLEWVGAVARNANILYVYSTDVWDAVNWAIDNQKAQTNPGFISVISMSFGNCEEDVDEDFAVSEELLATTANSEGITWIASSGDTGPAACDGQFAPLGATGGLAVYFPALLPEVTGVGGTELDEGSGGDYWSSTNGANGGSALGYIPEKSWNDTSWPSLHASGGGASIRHGKPSWQIGLGVPLDGMRDVPDVSMAASGDHDPYIICTGGNCASGGAGSTEGGTSVAAPVVAGIVALLNQYLGYMNTQNTPGLGNINSDLYQLAQSSDDAFNDIGKNVGVGSNNYVPCFQSSLDCPLSSPFQFGYSVGPGYDQVTGLGSIDGYSLLTEWAPPLAVTLKANPSLGPATLTTTLTATISGTASGSINYTFWYNCTDSSTSVSEVMSTCGNIPTPPEGQCSSSSVGQKCNGMTASSEAVTAVYASPGVYTAKIIAEQGTAPPAENRIPVTVNASAVTVSSLIVSPSAVTGGSSVNGTVTLNAPAPQGGSNIVLTSQPFGIVQLPPSGVSIPAGSTTGTFAASTSYVPSPTTVAVTGSYNNTLALTTLLVNPQSSSVVLRGLSFSPTTVNSGASSTGTITLSSPAPSGGAYVTLTASPQGVVQLQPPVTIPSGGTVATFTLNTLTVQSPTNVAITAGYNNSSISAVVTVNPSNTAVVLSNLAFSPASIVGGGTASGTVSLSGPAPTGGASVTFTSSPSGMLQLSSVLIPSGSTSAAFSGSTSSVNSNTIVSVIASYSGSSASAQLTLIPSGGSVFLNSLTITPPSIVGGFSTQGNVFLTGPAPTGGAVVSLSSNNPHFVQVPTSQNVTVQPGYTSAAFPITTSFTSGTVGATINASYNNTMYGAAVTVLPVVASGVTFYPSSVDAGSPAPFTVYLNGPAPAGTSVSLTSSSPLVLQVSGSVPVPTGATSVSVTGTTFAVSSQTNVTVTATYNGGTAQGSLTVVPLSLIGFSLNPLEITGGSSVTGTVWLSDITPSGGVNVSLSSTSSLVQVPPTVNVSAGSSSATFTATTSGVSSITNVTVTASYNGTSYNLTLTLVPPLPYLESLSFAPATVDSGSSTIGTITLTSPAPLGGVSVSLTSSFYVAIVQPAIAVQSGATTATFTVTTQAIGFISPVTIAATYNGTTLSALVTIVPPGTPLVPSSLTLSPSVVIGGSSSTATVLLTGSAPAGGAALALSSDNAGVVVPPVITVPAGLNGATFTATTSSVSDVATATITATYGGLFESSLLTIEPTGTKPSGNPVPFLSAPLAPASQTPNGAGLTVTVNGSGFVPGAQLSWNGVAVPTTYVSASQVQASLPASNTQTNGSGVVTVSNPGPVNPPSNTLPEYLTYPTSAPSFNTLSMTSIELPYNVVVGDLNRDGKQDLIVGHSFSGLSVFLGNGDGTFGPELLLQGASPASAIGDFNGDGKPDIVTTSASGVNAVRLYLGNGDGTFTSTPDTPFASGYVGTTSLAVGDFNGDGKLDVVVIGNGLSQAYVFLGNGDGTFGAPASVGSVNDPFSIAVADFNGDGKLDLALSDFSNQAVAILFGNGDGTFQPQIEYSVNGYPNALAVADLNNDQHPDIAVANGGPVGGSAGGVSVILNNGNGTFAAPVNYSPGSEFYFLTAGDVNGDNKLDLVVGSNYPTQATLLFLGNGDGTFSAPMTLTSGTASDFNTVADLNGDGAPDVVVSNNLLGSGNISILLQTVVPILQVTPSSLSFTATQGAGSPPSLSVAIANTGGGPETWSATTAQAWVVLGQTSGTAPSTLSVSVNPAGLNPGTYTATITVTATGASNSPQAITVTLTVNPTSVVVSSLAFSPNTLTGAGTATGTVTLSGSAPVGGASVTLSSNNSAVQMPATATVLAGLVSGTFTATASTVTTQTIVTVTATYNGVSTTATLTLNPNTSPLTVTPASLSFGNQGIDSTSAAKKVTLTNNTGAVVTISSTLISGANPSDFSETATSCGRTLGVNKSCAIGVAFTPAASGTRSAMLTLTDSAMNSPQTVALSGTGVLQVTLSVATIAFGNQADGSTSVPKIVTLTNNTSSSLSVSSVALAGTNVGEFAVSSDTCGSSVGGHSSCTMGVMFEPVTPGAKTAFLTVTDSANNSPQSVTLSGTGIAPVLVNPSSLTFAAQKVGTTSLAKIVTIKNVLPTALTMSGNTFTGVDSGDFGQSGTTCGTTLAAGASCTVSITFSPAAKGSRVAVLNIADSAITSPQTVSLSGTGK
jgi:subtilase family serine protease